MNIWLFSCLLTCWFAASQAVLYLELKSFVRIGNPQYFISLSPEVNRGKVTAVKGNPTVPYTCPHGVLNGHNCKETVSKAKDGQCPKGTMVSGTDCIRLHKPVCPKGYLEVEGKCLVDIGCDHKLYDQIGNRCHEKCNNNYKLYYSNVCLSTIPFCPGKDFTSRKNNTECLFRCPEGMEISKDQRSCEEVKCPKFFKKVNGSLCQGNTNTCPLDYEKKGNQCIRNRCKNGLLLHGICFSRSCPRGYTVKNDICQMCLTSTHSYCSDIDRRCPSDFLQLGRGKNMRCVLICPRNYAAYGKYCHYIPTVGCSQNTYKFKNEKCVKESECPADHEIFGNECLPKLTESKLIINGRVEEKCGLNYVRYNGECIKITSKKCPEQLLQIEDSSYCVASCPKGFQNIRGICLNSINCEKNQFSFTNGCYNKCPLGTEPSNSTMSCKLTNACEDNQVYDLTRLRCIHPSQCIYGYFLNPEKTYCHKKDQCNIQNYMLNQYCVSSCPFGYEVNAQFCKEKSTRCPNLALINGTCVTQCPDGHVPNNHVCVKAEVVKKVCGVNKELSNCLPNSPDCTPKCVCKVGFVEKRDGDGDYCVPKETKCPYKHQLDLVFLIDGSKYLTQAMFNQIKFFIMESITMVYSSSLDVRISVYVYGDSFSEVILLYKTDKLCDAMSLITKMKLLVNNKPTTLVDAFRITRDVLMSQCNGARLGSTRQVIVISQFDEWANSTKKENILEQIEFNKKAGYRMTFVTIKNQIKIPESIYQLSASSIADLAKLQSRIFHITCKDFSCPSGYSQVKDKCEDVNECSSNMCHKSALCINTPGSFVCYCSGSDTYLGPAIGCSIKKEEKCNYMKNITSEICEHVKCKKDANCSSSNGMAFCVCPRGYTYNSLLGCIDVDECKQNPCLGNAAKCRNNFGSFSCLCPKGFQYNVHFGCRDIDECREKKQCSGNGICRNLIGSFECACHRGYEYVKGKGCLDIDECSRTKNLCKGNKVICKNTPGSFRCICEKGYEYKENNCVDINECIVNNTCPEGSLCKNKIGGFTCICAKGFLLDTKKNTCELDKSLNVIKPKADMIYGVDASSTMKDHMTSVVEMLKNIITDYKVKSLATIKHYFALTVGGMNSTVKIIYTEETNKNVLKHTEDIKYRGGNALLSVGLKASRELYEKFGQTNSSKLIVYVTATKPQTYSAEEIQKSKKEIARIKAEAKLLIIYVGVQVESKDWLIFFKKDELEEHVLAVSTEFISTIHKVIYQRTDRLIKCPNGFVFLDKVCQYKTSKSQYCKWDNKLYAFNSTWTSSCATYNCTENGVVVLETLCIGHDGECYKQNAYFPCFQDGKVSWRCKCRIVKHFDEETNKTQQRIDYIIILFNQTEKIAKAKVKDAGKKCHLPFKYHETWYYSCTAALSNSRWCAWDMNYRSGRFSNCIQEITSQCKVKGKIYQEGDKWEEDCNTVTCKSGIPKIIIRCRTLNNTCVPYEADNYPCQLRNGDRYRNCLCTNDDNGYGENTAIEGKITGKKKTEEGGGLVEFCENKNTGDKYEYGQTWVVDCFTLECLKNGVTKIKDKKCISMKGECIAPDSGKQYTCKIGDRVRNNCECIKENNEIVQISKEGGKAEKKVVKSKTTLIKI